MLSQVKSTLHRSCNVNSGSEEDRGERSNSAERLELTFGMQDKQGEFYGSGTEKEAEAAIWEH